MSGDNITLKEFMEHFRFHHYSKRLLEERQKDNTPAIMFLKTELYNLKKLTNGRYNATR